MTLAGLGVFVLLMALLIALGKLNDFVLAMLLRDRTHRLFVWLGVIVHEFSHFTACRLTGTAVHDVAVFEADGGYVKHDKRGPMVTAFIGLAPVVGVSLFIMLLVWLFGFAGVRFTRPDINLEDPFATLLSLLGAAGESLWTNLSSFSIATVFFLLFLYLVWSLVACIAPSRPDLKHAAMGALMICGAAAIVVILQPLQLFGIGGTPALDWLAGGLSSVIGIGIIMSMVPLAVALPLALVKSRL